MPKPVLVFDMDGVLVDVTESYREAIRQTVRHFASREVTQESIQDFKNSGGWNNDWELSHRIIRDFGVNVDYDTVVAYFQTIFFGNGSDGMVLRERWIPRPGLLEGLGRGYRLAIFTGRIREEAKVTLDRYARGLMFDPVVCSDDVERVKPAPDGLLKIAQRTDGASMWYVGDTVDDARSSRAAAVPFIGIAAPDNLRRAELVSLFQSENAVAILDDINQLETVLKP
jgi:HAD superfamily hydrolase (TIGR01548 family)